MITKYILHNFKNHNNTELSMASLTVLTGINGTGKSSIIQSLLLLRESGKKYLPEELYLKGDSFRLGTSDKLMNGGVVDDQNILSMKITDDKGDIVFRFLYPGGAKDTLKAAEGSCELDSRRLKDRLSLFSDNFQYLSASRFGPMESYGSDTDVVDEHHQLSQKMGQGEYTVYYLDKFGSVDIPNAELSYPGVDDLSLKTQVEAWMGEISKGVRLNIHRNGDKYDLEFGYVIPGKKVEYHSALNSGYGLSYILSIVVAVLSAKSGSLLLIENPEAHIHPSGQSALMKLIGLAAKNGVQIIIETHSDHVINGALVAAKKGLNRENLSIVYFDKDEAMNARPNILAIEPNGRVINAPDGFCDQMEIDLDVLFEL